MGRIRTRSVVVALILIGSAAIVIPSGVSAQGNKDGLDVKVRAQNRSTSDTPAFCPGSGSPGDVGDTLDLDVRTEGSGAVSGTATFTAADGTTTVMQIDRAFVFFGGLALQDSSTRNTVPIWLGQVEEGGTDLSPVHVNVELPRGCGNTVSTFTVDVDKVTTQIKFQ